MSVMNEILDFNNQFVEAGEYEQFFTDKYPEKQLAIVSCMDARILDLLPRALGLKNGDAKLIKNAGALVTHPWGSVMRSLLVAVFELKVTEIMVIGHYDCGMQGLHAPDMLNRMRAKGISDERIDVLENAGIDLDKWLTGFSRVEDAVCHSVNMIRKHPLMPANIKVHGLVIHPTTGQLTVVIDGNQERAE
ncbi:carbonic anhydrase [Snodgrassella sp. CFCC 13594]|uniref:beta-class carbonic anhydrase n=1 Tax=Snodgrassella sp. CFCC 13594 TaxID=1775559 RepID=UPI0008365467|nr:carbonic anhydrase [Snodgrassella sp. CFCC 13594]